MVLADTSLRTLTYSMEDLQRTLPIAPGGGEASGGHAFEAQRHSTLCKPATDEVCCVEESSAPGGTIVVHICDGNRRQTKIVECGLEIQKGNLKDVL